MNDTRWVQLDELTEPERSITYGVVKPGPEPLDGGVTLIRGGDISNGRVSNDLRKITEEVSRPYRRTLLRGGELIMSLVGNPGSVAIVPEALAGANLARQAALIALQPSVDARFVMYWFMSPQGRERLAAVTKGSVQQVINLADLKRQTVPCPPIKAQRRIASILGAYDDLIEVNRRRVAVLEGMARALFEEAYVGQVTRHLSLGDVLTSLESGSRPKGGVTSKGDIPSIGAENINGLANHDFSKEKRIDHAFFQSMKRGIVQDGDVMLYKDGAHIGRTALAWKGYPHEICAVNEHVFLLRTKQSMFSALIFFFLSRPEVRQALQMLNTNAAQPGLNQKQVLGVGIDLPPQEKVEWFQDAAKPILDLIFNIASQKPKLEASRDLLLSRLISGKLSVTEAESQLEKVA